MYTAYLVMSIITIVINAAVAVADYVRAPFVLANSAEVDAPAGWLPWLATCKATGALGILAGLIADEPALVLVASTGLTLFYVGAIWFHLRARVMYNIAFPGFYLLTAVATLVLSAV